MDYGNLIIQSIRFGIFRINIYVCVCVYVVVINKY